MNILEEFDKVVKLTNNFTNLTIDIKENKIDNKKPISKTKCTICKKKTGLLGFNCKCNGNFCNSHRFPDQHNCIMINEIIKNDKEILIKQNIKVIADKLERI